MANPTLLVENVGDLVADTLKDLGKPKFTDISSNLQNHVAAKNLIRKNRMVLDSGIGIQFNVLVEESNAAANVGPLTPDSLQMTDGMVQASTVWRYSRTGYMIPHQFMSVNREPARIVDWVHQQRLMAMIALVEMMETNFWAAPAATDALTPLGIPYWVTKNGTTGFNGGTLTGYSNKAGLSGSTYPGWQNYTIAYNNVTRDDFIRSLRKGALFIEFKPPVDGIPSPNTGDDYGWYTNYSVLQPLEEVLESNNDNLGFDVDPMDGKVAFRRRRAEWVPWLERDTTNPWYGINWGWAKIYVMRGEWLRETAVPITPNLHNVHSQFVDLMYNFVFKNIRANLVASSGTTNF